MRPRTSPSIGISFEDVSTAASATTSHIWDAESLLLPSDRLMVPSNRSISPMTLGRMLFDLDYAVDKSGRGRPRFFTARLEGGILHVPLALYMKEA